MYNDALYLLKDFPNHFQIKGTFDLRYLVHYFKLQEYGLKKLARRLLNVEQNTIKSHAGWDQPSLSVEQILYAALDAYYGVLIFHKFYKMYTEEVRTFFFIVTKVKKKI